MNEVPENIIDTKYVKVNSNFAVGLIMVAVIFWFVWALFLNQWLGNTNIGSIFEKANYET